MQETGALFLGEEDPLEKKQQPIPVILPGKFPGQRSLTGYSPWGSKRAGRDWAHMHAEMPLTGNEMKEIHHKITIQK